MVGGNPIVCLVKKDGKDLTANLNVYSLIHPKVIYSLLQQLIQAYSAGNNATSDALTKNT